MKITSLLLTVLLLAVTNISFAQKKKPAATTAVPDAVVKNLHAANPNPFFQTKSRAPIDKFFAKEFADLIWADNNTQDGVGTINFDPLHGGQDNKITAFRIGKPIYDKGSQNAADVTTYFKNNGKAHTVIFRLERDANKTWKVSDIFHVNDNYSLRGLLLGEEIGTGELNAGKTDSAIVSVGVETGDYAALCFANDSEVGKQILAVCKDGDECEIVTTKIDYEFQCKVEGLEADLSSSGKIISVKSVKKLSKKK